MTYEEALKTCEMALKAIGISHSPQNDYNSVAEIIKEISKEKDIRTLIKCVEKQMPKKPKYKSKNSLPMCGECGGIIDILQGNANYCPNCGQALNWEESDCEIKDEGNKDFVFDYGIVEYQHRFSITRSLDDYEVTTLNKCIRMGIQYKYYTMACDKLIAEMQITYKDENNKLHCFTADLHDFTFSIKHKGDMQIDL